MKKCITINQISNPGISLTEETNKKILLIEKIILENNNKQLPYKKFQEYLINNKIFTGSYIRSLMPFLYNLGFINDYKEGVDFSQFFTSLGEAYIECIKALKKISEKSNEIVFNMKEIKSDIILMGLNDMEKKAYNFYCSYCQILKFLKKYNSINREQFFILKYCEQNKLDEIDYIQKYKKNPNSFIIKIINVNNEKVSYKSNNSFNYFIALLSEEQGNLVKKIDQNNFKLNNDKIEIINELLKENMEDTKNE